MPVSQGSTFLDKIALPQSLVHHSWPQSYKRLILAAAGAVTLLLFIHSIILPHQTYTRSSYLPSSFRGSTSSAAEDNNSSPCDLVPQHDIAGLHERDEFAIFTYANGKPLSTGHTLQTPSRVCMIVAVPQVPLPDDRYPDMPREGYGPDDIHFLLDSGDVIMTFPPLRPISNQPEAAEQISNRTVLYHAEPTFLSQGDYHIYAEREWSNWRWVQEWGADEDNGNYMVRSGDHPQAVGDDHQWLPRKFSAASMYPPMIRVEGHQGPPPDRPTCNNSLTASKGRWYRVDKALVNTTEYPSRLVDEWGYKWEGDYCRLEYYNTTDVFDCLSGKNIHDYGASNSRRLAKMLISGGTWCNDPHHNCQDSDDDHYANIDWLRYNTTSSGGEELVEVSEPRGHYFRNDETGEDTPDMHFGRNATLHFKFITSITNNTSTWLDELYDPHALTVLNSSEPFIHQDRTVSDPSAQPRAPMHKHGRPDLVLIATGAWDSVFTNWFTAFEESIAAYRDAFMGAYGTPELLADVPIVLHVSPSYCCRPADYWFRRYTGARLQAFDDIARRAFGVDDGTAKAVGGRMDVLDPVWMNGRSEVVWDYGPSGGNHFRAEHQVTEMTMLLNSVCVRDPETGKARFRKDVEKETKQRSVGGEGLDMGR